MSCSRLYCCCLLDGSELQLFPTSCYSHWTDPHSGLPWKYGGAMWPQVCARGLYTHTKCLLLIVSLLLNVTWVRLQILSCLRHDVQHGTSGGVHPLWATIRQNTRIKKTWIEKDNDTSWFSTAEIKQLLKMCAMRPGGKSLPVSCAESWHKQTVSHSILGIH